MKRKVCVVTGTRAEYGLLYWPMKAILQSATLELQLVVTGMHTSEAFGSTWKVIEADGFTINEKFSMLSDDDSAVGIATATGRAVAGFATAFDRLKPDIIVVLGDRYELLAAAQTALFMNIPIAHISGGDTTEGAFDEAIRHSITKMSHLHMVTNAVAARRVRQLGEDPAHIHNVGNPGLDHLQHTPLLSRQQLEAQLGVQLKATVLLVTFHPVTLEQHTGEAQLAELFAALAARMADGNTTCIITKSNSDTGGLTLNKRIDDFVAQHSDAHAFTSLGSVRYLSLMAQARIVVGNSSSGLLEAPSLKVPTVNIGDRQKGRLAAASVVHAAPEKHDILRAMREAETIDCSGIVNPYGQSDSSARIRAVLENIDDYGALLKKKFFDLGAAE